MATVTSAIGRKPIGLLSRNPADPRAHIDWGLIIGVLLLVGGGMVAIYTATYQNRSIAGLDTLYFVKRQALALAVGLVGMAFVMLLDYRKLREWSLILYLGVLGMLAAVLVVARARNGVDAWFDVGPFQLQPSEFAKVVIVLVLAGYLARERSSGELTFPRFVTALGIVAVPAGILLHHSVLPVMAHGANSGLPPSLLSVYTPAEAVLLALAGLAIAVAGALGPAAWAASARTAAALRAE